MKAADRSGANYALLIGTEERRHGTVRIKDLESGDQQDVAVTSATDWLLEALATEGQRDEP
jgi:histidyl-tRNA synthetase